jgi:hypothetical protein
LLKYHSQQPFNFSPSIINETIPSSNCFALLHNAETPLIQHSLFLPIPKTFQSSILPNILIPETTPSSTCFVFPLPLLEHHYPLLKHQQSFIFFPVVETPFASNPSSLFRC